MIDVEVLLTLSTSQRYSQRAVMWLSLRDATGAQFGYITLLQINMEVERGPLLRLPSSIYGPLCASMLQMGVIYRQETVTLHVIELSGCEFPLSYLKPLDYFLLEAVEWHTFYFFAFWAPVILPYILPPQGLLNSQNFITTPGTFRPKAPGDGVPPTSCEDPRLQRPHP